MHVVLRQDRVHGGSVGGGGGGSRPVAASLAMPAGHAEAVQARLPSGLLSGFGGMLPAPGFSFSPPSPSANGALSSGGLLGQQLFPLSSHSPQPSFQWPLSTNGFNPDSPSELGGKHQQQQQYMSERQADAGDGSAHGGSAHAFHHPDGGDWSAHGVSLVTTLWLAQASGQALSAAAGFRMSLRSIYVFCCAHCSFWFHDAAHLYLLHHSRPAPSIMAAPCPS